MDLDDIQSNLCALRKLYGLLKNKRDGPQNANSENLDEKSRLLLKNLLDDATAKIFDAQPKIMASQGQEFNAQTQQPRDILEQQPSATAIISSTNSSEVQYSSNGQNFPKLTWLKDEKAPRGLTTLRVTSDWSKLSTDAHDFENRKKRCRVCQLRSGKQLECIEKIKLLDEVTPVPNKDFSQQQGASSCSLQDFYDPDSVATNKKDSGRIIGSQAQKQIQESRGSQSSKGSLGFSFNRDYSAMVESGAGSKLTGDVTKNPKKAHRLCKEADNAIKQIELHFSDLQLAEEHVGPLEKSSAELELHGVTDTIPGKQTVTPLAETKEGIVTRTNQLMSSKVMEPRDFNHFPGTTMMMNFPDQLVSNETLLLFPKQSNGVINLVMPHQVGKSNNNDSVYDRLSLKDGMHGEEHKMSSQQESRASGQNVETILEQIGLESTITREEDVISNMPYLFVQGLEIPLDRNKVVNNTPHLPAELLIQNNKENFDQNGRTQTMPIKKLKASQMTIPFMGPKNSVANQRRQKIDAGHKLNQWRNVNRRKMGAYQMTRRPTLLDQKPCQLISSPTFFGDRKGKNRCICQKNNIHVGIQRNIEPPYYQESEGTSSSSSSSSWTNKQPNTGSDSGEYRTNYTSPTFSNVGERSSLSSSIQGHHVHPNTDSEKETSKLPRTRRYHGSSASVNDNNVMSLSSMVKSGEYVYPTSSSDTEVCPLPSPTEASPGSSNQSEGYSSPDQPQVSRYLSPSYKRRMCPANINRPTNRTKPRKQQFKKLKDKMAIIFHHHHHHHHHHRHHYNDGYDDDDHGNHQVKVRNSTSLWKHAGKPLHQRDKNEAYEELAVEKLRKSAAHSTLNKNQHGHFHALVEGLLGYVKPSKKSKLSKDGIHHLRRDQPGGKKALKKFHWWQTLRRHRGRKVPSKSRVKLFESKEHQFRALPKIGKDSTFHQRQSSAPPKHQYQSESD